MANNSSTSSRGIGFSGALTIAFQVIVVVMGIVLKLIGVINWSWWWVLSPLWITFLITILVLLIVLIIAIIKSEK